MSETRRIEGRTLEEVLEEAGRLLGRPVEERDYRMVESRKGILSRRTVIELTVPAGTPEAPEPAAGAAAEAPEEALPAEQPAREPSARPPAPAEPVDRAEAERAALEVAEEIVHGIGLSLRVRSLEPDEEGRLLIVLEGGDEGRMTARHGELLGATQYLLQKVVARRFGAAVPLAIDAGEFRVRREEELRTLARRTADVVKESGKKALLPPLPPAERRQVHLALAADPDVETESEGEGLKKRVAIFPRRSSGR